MKKIFFGLIVFVVAACNNDGENGTTGTSPDTIENKTTVIDNVNGNLPDTINTIEIDQGNRGTKDTTR